MPKKFYCQLCGTELVHRREAIPGKGVILDLITPHECEGYSIRSNEFGSPTVQDVIDNLKDLGKTIEAVSQERHSGFREGFEDGDRRKDIKTTSAPSGLAEELLSMPNSEPENT